MAFSFKVPKKPAARIHTVPPKGRHKATATATLDMAANVVMAVNVDWTFEAEGRQWTLRQSIAWNAEGRETFGRVCAALGLSGSISDVSDLDGRVATVVVKTYGDRSMAKVEDVESWVEPEGDDL